MHFKYVKQIMESDDSIGEFYARVYIRCLYAIISTMLTGSGNGYDSSSTKESTIEV